jgi:hypothetical protein
MSQNVDLYAFERPVSIERWVSIDQTGHVRVVLKGKLRGL